MPEDYRMRMVISLLLIDYSKFHKNNRDEAHINIKYDRLFFLYTNVADHKP